MNIRHIILSVTGAVFMSFPAAHAQENLLTLEEAVSIALKNNYDIQMASNTSRQAELNNTVGNAGMLPSVTGNGGFNYSAPNSNIHFADGRTQNVNGAQSYTYTAGVALNWRVFDGLGMFVSKKRLNELERIGMIQFKQQVQQTVADVIGTYADVIRQQQFVHTSDTLMAITAERRELAKKKFEVGSASKVDYTQSIVDYNTQKTQRFVQNNALWGAKRKLNILLGRESEIPFAVSDSIAYRNLESKETYMRELEEKNLALQLAASNISVAQYNKRIYQSQMSPTLDLGAAYNYNRSESQAGFATFSQSIGPQAGLTLKWNIFNGFNLQRQIKVAGIDIMQQELFRDNLKNTLSQEVVQSYQEYEAAVEVVNLSVENMQASKENLTIAWERYKTGLSTYIEFREAQQSFENARTILSGAKYQLKIWETRLLQLQNELIQ